MVHVVQAVKLPTWQSTAHACALHERVSAVCGQALPPTVGCTCVRERDCAPVPHDLVHVVQAPKVATWQSAGHVCALHARVSAECGHAAPPFTGAAFVRERLCAPVPHDLVHVVHTLKLPSTQSTGQLCALHERVSASCGHAAPP